MQALRTQQDQLQAIAFWGAFGSAACAVASIAASQILLGVALFCLIASRTRPVIPPFAWPLGVFVAFTLLSLALSPDPAAGLPQVRKFYVLLGLFAVATTFKTLRQSRWLVGTWCVLGTASALWSLWQFWTKWSAADAAGAGFYVAYIGDRITGFAGHWMTFSGQMMIVLLFGGALLLHGNLTRAWRLLLSAALGVAAIALVLGMTRGIWIATFAGAVYLLWTWRRVAVAALPVIIVAAIALGPASLQDRVKSLVRPHGETDSNSHRYVVWRTGIEIIKAHPLLGVGPEMVGKVLDQYVPHDIPRPLPVGYYAHLHNIYIHYAAERGIPAMLGIVAVFVLALRRWLVALRDRAHPAKWLLHAGVAAVIGILVTGLTEHNLGDSEILMLSLSALGVVERGSTENRDDAIHAA